MCFSKNHSSDINDNLCIVLLTFSRISSTRILTVQLPNDQFTLISYGNFMTVHFSKNDSSDINGGLYY